MRPVRLPCMQQVTCLLPCSLSLLPSMRLRGLLVVVIKRVFLRNSNPSPPSSRASMCKKEKES